MTSSTTQSHSHDPLRHSSDELKSILREFFRKAYTEGDESVIDTLMAPDVLHHGLARDPIVGRDAFRRWYHAFRGSFTDTHCSLTHICVEDDLAAARVLFTGTHSTAAFGFPPTGNQVSLSAVILCRFEHGQVAEAFNEFDHLSLLQQLGAIPT